MKKFLAIALALVMVLGLVGCTQPNNNGGENTPEPQPGEVTTYDIKVWVAEEIAELTKKQIDRYNETNTDGIKFNAAIQSVSEANAATDMITDVEAGGDIFCFAQDQFARLVTAGALSKLGVQAAATVKEANAEGVVAAATIGEDLYAYPMTQDNGYFMYYDKSVIPESDVDSLEALIKDCEDNQKYFAMELQTSAWYLASFFFGTGCKSEWKLDNEGNYESVYDTFDSPEGLIAVKGMKKLLDSNYHVSSAEASQFASGAAIVVTGIWAYEDIQGLLGDNMGVTDLPSFEVDGQSYHIGSFNGCKLMGVKPQSDPAKGAAIHKLAQYLTNEECQMERFNERSWGPSNKNAAASEAVQANPGLAALLKQAPYSVPQGQIHGSWWDIAKVIGEDVKNATDEAGLQAALDSYKAKISALFNMSEDDKNAWSVIGTCNSTDGFFYTDYQDETRSNWSEDIPMTEVEPGIWRTTQAWAMEAGCEFKCRQGASWDNAFPADNFKVETAGTYYVQLVVETGEVSLIPAE